ncbi:MAG: hypothetical protein M0Q91_17630 [Methanoregula sp.]|jgi:hypothetical protein|nr:hypothetical protein [Methanoregula sp.]
MKIILTKEDVEHSRSLDRGALALKVYAQCKKCGLLGRNGKPTAEAIRKLNEALDEFDQEHMITDVGNVTLTTCG